MSEENQMDYFKFCLFTAPLFHWNINVIRWIKNQTDSAVIKATHLVGLAHLVINVYEYGGVNITKVKSKVVDIILRCTLGGFPC